MIKPVNFACLTSTRLVFSPVFFWPSLLQGARLSLVLILTISFSWPQVHAALPTGDARTGAVANLKIVPWPAFEELQKLYPTVYELDPFAKLDTIALGLEYHPGKSTFFGKSVFDWLDLVKSGRAPPPLDAFSVPILAAMASTEEGLRLLVRALGASSLFREHLAQFYSATNLYEALLADPVTSPVASTERKPQQLSFILLKLADVPEHAALAGVEAIVKSYIESVRNSIADGYIPPKNVKTFAVDIFRQAMVTVGIRAKKTLEALREGADPGIEGAKEYASDVEEMFERLEQEGEITPPFWAEQKAKMRSFVRGACKLFGVDPLFRDWYDRFPSPWASKSRPTRGGSGGRPDRGPRGD